MSEVRISSNKQGATKSSAQETEEAIDRWFSFVKDWNKNSTVPLSHVLITNRGEKGLSTPGSPTGAFNLDKRELKRCSIIK